MTELLTLVAGISAVVGGICGFAALVLVLMKKDCQPAVVAFGISMVVCFVALFLMPRA